MKFMMVADLSDVDADDTILCTFMKEQGCTQRELAIALGNLLLTLRELTALDQIEEHFAYVPPKPGTPRMTKGNVNVP